VTTWPRSAVTNPLPHTVDADSVAGPEAEFFFTLKAARESIEGAAHDSVYLHGGNDEWRREVESLKHDLDKVESGNR
jgi:hypothetical protein